MTKTTFLLSADGKTQIETPMGDVRHRTIWGRFSYSNRQYENAELVVVPDADVWIAQQLKIKNAR